MSFSAKGKKEFPFAIARVAGGFPSPADDGMGQSLDLNEYLVKHPEATFFIRVEGDSMENAGIFSGDLLLVDRAIEPKENSIVVAALDGEFTVKRMKKIGSQWYLSPENKNYPAMPIQPEADFTVWGVVAYVIHKPL